MAEKRVDREPAPPAATNVPLPLASVQELARFRQAVEASGDVIFMTDLDGLLTYVNPAFSRLYGYSPSEVVGQVTPCILKSGVVSSEAYTAFWQALTDKQVVTGPVINRAKDGTLVEVESSANPILDDSGNIVGFLAVQRDITERRHNEDALRASEARYRTLAESAEDAIFIIDRDLRVQYVNRFASQALAASPATIVGKTLGEVFPPEIATGYGRGIGQVLAGGEPTYTEGPSSFVGREAWLGTRLVPLRNDAGATTGVLGVSRDITERKKAEEALRKREAELKEAQRVAGVGSWEWSVQTGLITWSEELYRIIAVDPSTPPPSFEGLAPFYTPESWALLQAVVGRTLETGAPYEVELTEIRADGVHIWTSTRGEAVRDDAGQIVGLRGTVLDITERKNAEEKLRDSETRLRQAQKMEAVGQLAGGVAHDFNNLLTVILGNANLMMDNLLMPSEIQRAARNVIESAERGANLTRQLLAFGRQQIIHVGPVALNGLLADLLKMLGPLLGEDISVRCDYAIDLPRVEADAGMIEQIIVNLAVNARDAMPQGGSLIIATRVVDVDAASAALNPEARVGRFVALDITDTGNGMDPATLAHIFEPFFTTKDVGKGTGLGLATVHGIVKQHRGWIDVATEMGRGSLFTVFLPIASGKDVAEAQAQSTPAVGGHNIILVVEDEPALRRLAVTYLKRWGYRVFEAASGIEALREWDEHPERIDLLLTDMVMPDGVSGRELARRLRLGRPDLKVIYSSGYSRETLDTELELRAGDSFLSKPYAPATLAQVVKRCLDVG